MEHYGERRTPLIPLDKDLIEKLVRPVFPEHQVVTFSLLTGGYSHTNYKIEFVKSSTTPIVLRVFPYDADAAETEAQIIESLQNTLPVPKVIYFDKSFKQLPYCYAFFEWKKGPLLSQVFNSLINAELHQISRKLGEFLFKLSRFQFPAMGLLGPGVRIQSEIHDFYNFVLTSIEKPLVGERTGKRLGPELSQAVLNLIKSNRSLIEEASTSPTLVHGDFNGKNILIQKNQNEWEISGVIDWEYACSGPFLADFGNLLRYDSCYPNEFGAGLIEGFQSCGGILPQQWKKTSKLLDLMNLCDFLNSEMERPILWADSKILIEDTLNRWNRFE